MKVLLTTISLLFWIPGGFLGAQSFTASAFKVDITPPAGVEMWGYSARQGVSTGTLDPLFAKGLVLSDGGSRLALVTLDLGRTFSAVSLEEVRRVAKERASVDQVFFFASHTHSGPSLLDHTSEADIPGWERAMLRGISEAIVRSSRNLIPATIGTGSGATLIGHNRIRTMEDGTVRMFWRNATRVPTSPVDDHVGVLRVDSDSGEPLALLVNYSCHPVVLGPDNLEYSADYPGAMSQLVESHLPGTVVLFLQGAPGDINPYFDKTPLLEDGARHMRETGRELGREVIRVAQTIRTAAPARPSLHYSLETLPFSLRWDREAALEGLRPSGEKTVRRYSRLFSKKLELPVTTVLINREIVVTGMPGEPYVDFAIQSRQRFPAVATFFGGYANGHFGYLPTLEGAVRGGYGGDSLGAWIEVGAGERMLDHSLIRVHEMLGNLKDEPRR